MALLKRERPQLPECRVLLVGKTGSGKSATGNTIRDEFKTGLGLGSVTMGTVKAEVVRDGRRIVIVDTPGFYDTVKGNELISSEMVKIYRLLSPGFHVLIFVMGTERFTNECVKIKKLFFKIFGPSVAKYTMIIVTGKDKLDKEGVSQQSFVASGNEGFHNFLKSCSGRLYAIDNTTEGSTKQEQVDNVFKMIAEIQHKVGGRCYTNLQFQTMKLYKKIGQMDGKVNVNKARQSLFKRISQRYGSEGKCVWGPNNPDSKRLKLTIKRLSHNEGTCETDDVEIVEADDTEDEDVADADGTDTESAIISSSYFDRLISFFKGLFRTLFNSPEIS